MSPSHSTPAARRSYDTAADPTLSSVIDPVLGFSALDVKAAMLGSFAGTYTMVAGGSFAIEMALGVDGVIVVRDERDGTSEWSAPLLLAMSSEPVDGVFLIDDLWSPVLMLRDLTAGHVRGMKPSLDGAMQASGRAQIELRFVEGKWRGTLGFGGVQHGSFEVVAAVLPEPEL